ncbi:NADPH-dependent curcumin reductase CurA [Paraburkholderia sp. GAS199]|uniref:NADP-dependent oxidoreductase n=1 Tax=Paraburkholderia sp. GAS199 TaxID=3035126 RepID=UPI003D2269C1
MTIATSTQVVLASRPTGRPTVDNFRIEQAALPATPPNGVLLRVLYLSLDPYMRGRMDARKSYAPAVEIDQKMTGEAVAEVVESRHPDYRVGELVLAPTGWCDYAVIDATGLRKVDPALSSPSARLGVLGMPGFTAYSGLMLIGQPKAGDTVVVAAASGPVGSLVGQLAQMAGARAIGIAGGADKCRYVKDELGFDAAIDHRAPDMADQLAAACPGGIDVYFENVGGKIWQAVLPLLNRFARVPVCGLIAQYSGADENVDDRLSVTMRQILTKSLLVRGFINYEFADEHYPEFLRVISDGIRAGRILHKEDVVEGLEKAPEAFLGMLEGKNFGKVVVRVATA